MFDRWASRILLVVVGGIPLLFVLDLKDTFDLPKIVFVYISIIALTGLWAWTVMKNKEVFYHSTSLDKPLAFFLVFALVSTYCSVEPTLSFWGAYRLYIFGCLPMTAFAALYWFSAQ